MLPRSCLACFVALTAAPQRFVVLRPDLAGAGWVSAGAVADLSEQLGGGDRGGCEPRQKDRAVGTLANGGGDPVLELGDLRIVSCLIIETSVSTSCRRVATSSSSTPALWRVP